MYCTQPIRRAASITPNKVATVFGERERTFQDMRNRVACRAAALRDVGVEEGGRVAILALNSDNYLECFFAVPWAGGVVVPLNIRWSVAENVYSLEDSGSTVLLVDDAFLGTAEEIREKTDQIKTCIYIGDGQTPSGMLGFEEMIAASSPMDDAMRGYEDLFGIFYTGGTTGFPKGVMISHRNLYTSSLAAMASLDMTQGGTRYLHAAPMFHLADGMASMANTIAGNTHVFIAAFEPGAVTAAIERHAVTDVLLVPTMISMIVHSGALNGRDCSSLSKIFYGASPMPEGVLRKALEALPDVDFYQAYGQTELAPLATVLRPEYHVFDGPQAGKLRSAGQPCYIVDLKVVDAEGTALPPGEVGEVVVRGPNAMMGYWNRPEQTAAALKDGWVYTGDAGYLDEDGFLFVVDRVKDMIISGGENVFSAEVESAVSRHPKVNEVAVVGIPSVEWGESVHAIVRVKDGEHVTEKEIIDFCRELIAGYKCPRSVEFREEPFPMTGAGKLRKMDLRKRYWEGKDKQVN